LVAQQVRQLGDVGRDPSRPENGDQRNDNKLVALSGGSSGTKMTHRGRATVIGYLQ
jgi:hypothetical protein